MLAVIGCGNTNRSDDGVGSAVIETLRKHHLAEGTVLFDAGTDGMSVMYQARGLTGLIIVDAKVPEGNPGSIFAVPGNVLAKPPNASFNLHDFRWDHALHAGKQIYKDEFPEQIKVFLIEAQSLELGIGLSAPVTKAVDTVALQISEIAKTFVADREFSS